jgi:serine/threonine protein kinase
MTATITLQRTNNKKDQKTAVLTLRAEESMSKLISFSSVFQPSAWIDATDAAELSGLQFDDVKTGKRYVTVKKITTTFEGDFYSAVVVKSDVTEVPADTEPTHIIKKFIPRPRETESETNARANREYALTTFFDYRARHDELNLENPCTNDALCAEGIFRDGRNYILVFPFQNAMDLKKFIRDRLYPTLKRDESNKNEFLKAALRLSYLIVKAVERLNAFGIYHGNIEPRNIMVSYKQSSPESVPRIKGVRLFDFDFSCMELGPALSAEFAAAGIKTASASELTCGLLTNLYSPKARFRDPRASKAIDFSQSNYTDETKKKIVGARWSKYEMFATASVLYIIFDPDQSATPKVDFNNVYNTTATPAILEVIREMIIDPEGRPSFGAVAIKLQTLESFLK